MIRDRAKVVFSAGFVFGVTVFGILNYVTLISPRSHRGEDGSLNMHGPRFSGFPFDMYMDGYVFDMFLADGLVGNILVGLAIGVAFGWIATKFFSRTTLE